MNSVIFYLDFFFCYSNWIDWGIVEVCMYVVVRKFLYIVNICLYFRGEIVKFFNVSKKIYRFFGNVIEIY